MLPEWSSMANLKSPIDLTSKLLSFIEEDANQWQLAANNCEAFLDHLPEKQAAVMGRNVGAYRARAAAHREFVAELKSEIGRT